MQHSLLRKKNQQEMCETGSNDSDLPEYPLGMNRVFAVYMKNANEDNIGKTSVSLDGWPGRSLCLPDTLAVLLVLSK